MKKIIYLLIALLMAVPVFSAPDVFEDLRNTDAGDFMTARNLFSMDYCEAQNRIYLYASDYSAETAVFAYYDIILNQTINITPDVSALVLGSETQIEYIESDNDLYIADYGGNLYKLDLDDNSTYDLTSALGVANIYYLTADNSENKLYLRTDSPDEAYAYDIATNTSTLILPSGLWNNIYQIRYDTERSVLWFVGIDTYANNNQIVFGKYDPLSNTSTNYSSAILPITASYIDTRLDPTGMAIDYKNDMVYLIVFNHTIGSNAGFLYAYNISSGSATDLSAYVNNWNSYFEYNYWGLYSYVTDLNGNPYVAGDTSGMFGFYNYSGQNWVNVTSKAPANWYGMPPAVYDMAVDKNGTIYTSGFFDDSATESSFGAYYPLAITAPSIPSIPETPVEITGGVVLNLLNETGNGLGRLLNGVSLPIGRFLITLTIIFGIAGIILGIGSTIKERMRGK